jgi:hypothetical protein
VDFTRRSQISIQAGYVKNAAPEAVYAWLEKNRAETGLRGKYIPREISDLLLKRNYPLVNLGLAQFTNDSEILRAVYATGDTAVKCAVLANPLFGEVFRSVGRYSGGDFQCYFFDSEDELREFIRSANDELIEAYFTNPSITGDTLKSLFSRWDLFSDLDDSRWRTLVISALQNPRLHQEENEGWIFDAFAEAMRGTEHDGAIQAAWNLLRVVPPTTEWAATSANCWNKMYYAGSLQSPEHMAALMSGNSTAWQTMEGADELNLFRDVLERWKTGNQSDTYGWIRRMVAARALYRAPARAISSLRRASTK